MNTLAGRYQLRQQLGQGGFGETFLAIDLQRPGHPRCVVKHLKPLMCNDTALHTARRLFQQESEVLYRLGHHDQIPQLLAHFEENGEFYLVQDFIEGRSLEGELQLQPWLPESEVLHLLAEVLNVLAAVHEQGIIHRDIKPANLMQRSQDRRLMLIDFGAVKQINRISHPHDPVSFTIAVGSLGYMAPEQQANRPCLASDLYAVGMVALRSLTGQHPEDLPRDRGDVSLTHLDSRWRDRLPTTPGLAEFLERLVRYDYRHRPADAIAALNEFQTIAADVPRSIQTLPPTLTPITAHPVYPTSQTIPKVMNSATSDGSIPLEPLSRPTAIAPPSPLPPLSRQSLRNRQALLNKVQHFWIDGVLNHSLHHQVAITLGLEERPNAVVHPWTMELHAPDRPQRDLPSGMRLISIFDDLGVGRSLLILGEPGSGKTTTLLELTRDLLTRAQQDVTHPMPVVFNLSSWSDRQPLADWLVQELNVKYQVPIAIGQRWVKEQQLLLLLDGLDEVQRDRRNACLAAINQFHQHYAPEIVVCSRIQDYHDLSDRLQFQTAVLLQPLTLPQIQTYLVQAGSDLAGLRAIMQDADPSSLSELARSPLMLSILTLTYSGVPAADIPNTSHADHHAELFDAYLQRMFQRRTVHRPYSDAQTLHWLHYLAQHLVSTSQTVFLIERMQPDRLRSHQRWHYILGIWLSFFLLAGSLGSVVLDPSRLIPSLIIGSVILAKIFGVDRIKPAETLQWSWQRARTYLLWGLAIGPLIGIALKYSFGLVFGRITWGVVDAVLIEQLIQGTIFGLTFGLTFGLIRGLSANAIATLTRPNQGIRQSARNALLFAAIATQAPMLIAWIIGGTKISFWGMFGLCFGLATGGGEACIKHCVLRIVLVAHRVAPWNYSKFLDYCCDRIFLQKVGGGYIFIHRLLLEHIARRSPSLGGTSTQTGFQ